MKMVKDRQYIKLSHVDHILKRPDMYTGSTSISQTRDIVIDDDKRLVQENLEYYPALVKIFDEILVNALDHSVRDSSMSKIIVTITNTSFSVENDGTTVPIRMHEEENVWIPELVFGHLLTSTNYDDSESRIVGGRNGLGAKLTNVFSVKFRVEISDGKQIYTQEYKNNMKIINSPKIRATKSSKSYTKITSHPDFSLFGTSYINQDTIRLMTRRVYDIAAMSDVKVKLNTDWVRVKNIQNYAAMGTHSNIVMHACERWNMAFSVSPGISMSFVNGVYTSSGGTHVEYIINQVVAYLRKTIGKKLKTMITLSMVRESLCIILDCRIVNPEFTNQQKDTLATPVKKFGSTCQLPESLLKRLIAPSFGLLEHIESMVDKKQDKDLKKSDGKMVRRLNIPKLDDANWAGTSKSNQCILILTEGDSAKALAIAGLSVVGRNQYGVFPLRGKLLNVRDASKRQIAENSEIQSIKRILGLEHGKKYTSTKDLRYGSIMIMTDADVDGSHIKGLVLNFFDSEFPGLLSIPGFMLEFVTPVIRAKKGTVIKTFFTQAEYANWAKSTSTSGWSIKYYKGLGTSSSSEAREYFQNLRRHRIEFVNDKNREDSFSLAFSKKRSDDRKTWIAEYAGGDIDHDVDTIQYSDFVHKELVLFSRADVVRSIPSMMDGLKPGQRKVLFAAFKRNLHTDIKVAQFAGYVAEHSAYHHGEMSLSSTIIGMAQEYTGSNNINMLVPSGQFGTRIMGGHDAASSRYIYTRLHPVTRHIFMQEDDHIVKNMIEEGQDIEPEWYVPIIPMLLVNGASGIGTGWSTHIPCYNPDDIISNIILHLDSKPMKEMYPWYRGFTGDVVPTPSGFETHGRFREEGNHIIITELPVGRWTHAAKEYFMSMQDPGNPTGVRIRQVTDNSTDTEIYFDLELSREEMNHAKQKGIETVLKLVNKISTTNMVAFDPSGRIRKYTTPLEIIKEYVNVRLRFYENRKSYLLGVLRDNVDTLRAKIAFIEAVMDERLILFRTPREDVLRKMRALDLPDIYGSYDPLLRMHIQSFTKEKIDDMKGEFESLECRIQELESTIPKDMWLNDIKNLQQNM
jgi:DNA topoisomerase-2